MSSTPSSLLTSLPTELCNTIIFFMPSTKDLLNLALTCRQLCQLIIPDHIDYRQIVCSMSDKFVWEHLLNRLDLARRIHSVKVLDSVEFKDKDLTGNECRVIPRKLQMQQDAEHSELEGRVQLKVFTKSITIMKNLYSFDYGGPCPAFLLFTRLAHCSPGLRIFKYNYEWTHPAPWDDIIDAEIHFNKGFENLGCCSLNIRFQGKYDNEANVLTMVDSLLDNNPSLESLTLFLWDTRVGSIYIPRFFSGANWSKIRFLSLGGDFTFFKEDVNLQLRTALTQTFFLRHPSLEKIRLRGPEDIPIYPGSIQSDMLPKLDTLDLDFETAYHPISELIPENVVARLRNLSVNLFSMPDSSITSGRFNNLRKLFTEISSNRIPSLLEVIPNIERLHITLNDSELSTDKTGQKPGILHFLPAFTKYTKSLTHLSLILPFHAEGAAPEEYARELHRLEFIQFPCLATVFNSWYRVIRSPPGTVGLEKHSEESDEWATHLWMGFDSSFE